MDNLFDEFSEFLVGVYLSDEWEAFKTEFEDDCDSYLLSESVLHVEDLLTTFE